MDALSEAGSRHAARHLYVDHHSWLQGWLHRRVNDRAQAADLSHDVFVRLLSTGAKAPVQEPRAFLVTLARRTLFTFWRRRDLERAYLAELAAQDEDLAPSAEDQVQMQRALETIDCLLAGLPPRARQAFLLNRLEGLTYPEIAEITGVSLATTERDMKSAWLRCWQHRRLCLD